MLVVSDNLKGIVDSFGICDATLVEEFSIGVRLNNVVRRMRDDPLVDQPIVYGTPYQEEDYFEPLQTISRDLQLGPRASILACSADRYKMPPGYFGLLQTKGSLARLFVSIACNDGQIEPGFEGAITLEMTNHGPSSIAIPVRSLVGQLFVFRCSTEVNNPYNGRYQNAAEPTLARF